MKTVRSILLITLCAYLFTPLAAGEEGGFDNPPVGEKWAKGTVQASETVYLYAPMGGQMEAFTLSAGDTIQRDEVLMQVRPMDVPAPYDGVIRIQHAKIGDSAENVVREYGALCYLEREDVQWLSTTIFTAYNDADNRDIRVGEEVRGYNNKSGSKNKKEAEGRVVSVAGSAFVVEFPAGAFDIEETVRIYRGTGNEYKDRDRVGRGKVRRVPPIPIAAQGIVSGILVQEGQTVSRGETLYLLDASDARYENAGERHVTAPEDCVLTVVYVQPGQQVVKGQLLLTAESLANLECVVDVDELDILTLSVGQTMLAKLDAQPDMLLPTAIQRIAPLGKIMLDTTKY
ncbi:MAG: HlyD family efflux transporter periplasmic adaptor subunit, partial [Clostridia bacterium]|nr:HlyD family efflux transporter periplasmic adaptor subunit [Clostridia bacterium]